MIGKNMIQETEMIASYSCLMIREEDTHWPSKMGVRAEGDGPTVWVGPKEMQRKTGRQDG